MGLKEYRGVKNKLYLEGAFSFANFTLLNGIFLIGFALALGANNFQIGILVAIPLFANLLQLASAFILEIAGTRKMTAISTLFIGRVMWVFMITLAFGLVTDNNMLIVFMSVLFLSSVFTSIGNLALLSWMKEIVPLRKLASFWGKRNIYASIGGIIVYLIGAYIIDKFTGIEVYGYLFGIALFIGLIGIIFLIFIPEKKKKIVAIKPKKLVSRLLKPFKDEKFRPFLYFGMLWSFAINFAAAFFIVFMVDNLALSFFLTSSFLAVEAVSRIYGLSVWRNIADKFGAKPLLVVSATVTSSVPLVFLFINKYNYFLIPIIFFISSLSYSAVDIAFGQLMFKSAPKKYDAYYLASFTSLTGIMSAFGPILGGLLAVIIGTYSPLSHLNFMTPLKYVFLISFLLRVSCLPWISKIHEPKAKEVNDVVEKIKTLKYASFFVTIYSITDYTSKMVLAPHKQLFMLQRKTVERAKKDLTNIITVMSKISTTLGNLHKKILPRQEKKITELTDVLNKQVDKLEYIEGSDLQKIPQRVLTKMESLESSIEDEEGVRKINKKVKSAQKSIESNQEKLEKVYDDEIV